MVTEVGEQGALKGLCEIVGEHTQRGAERDGDHSSLDEVVDPEVTDVNVTGLLARGATTLDKLDCALIVLIYGDRWGGETLAGQESAGP